jgi:glycosyltransferase involved in cell wall biosynthesis
MQADLIVTQTNSQAELLQNRFGRTSITLYNPVDLSNVVTACQKDNTSPICLWIGKSDQVKRPEVLLQLALRFPDLKFIMIMNRSDMQIHEQIFQTAPFNLEVIESIAINEVEGLFQNAFVFINTSQFEGFPNTFLQAGKYRVPILSLQVSPDDFIEKHGCGIYAHGSIEELDAGLRRLIDDPVFYSTCAENIHSYVKTYHDLNDKVNELGQIIKAVQEG